MERMDVTALMLGLDAGARAEVSSAMNRIAEEGDSSGPEGLLQMLREAIAVLRGVERRWTHAGAVHVSRVPPDQAEARFAELAERARGRFDEELIRNVDGVTTRRAAPALPPTDAPGVVVVTIVVASRSELAGVSDVNDAAQLGGAFDAVVSLSPADFVAMEVVWSPADERDRIPVQEMERTYPELTRLAPGVA